jgi:hypothetical protein
MVPPVHNFQRRARGSGRVAGSSSGSFSSARAHGQPSCREVACRHGALALPFGDAVGCKVLRSRWPASKLAAFAYTSPPASVAS